MEKKVIICSAIILLSLSFIQAQTETKSNYEFSVNNIKEVVINCNGYTEINNSVTGKIDCELTLVKKGEVWGFSNKEKIEDPHLTSRIEDSTLYISLLESPGLYVIGISSYSENLKFEFNIPKNISVVINNSLNNYVNGTFKGLSINSEDETNLTLTKDQIKFLDCFSNDDQVIINGLNKGTHFVYEGMGSEVYIIKSSKINIHYK